VSLEDRIPQDHPLRDYRRFLDAVLRELSPLFDEIYADEGRRSIPPEQLLRALVLQLLYSIRSERQLMEQMDYNLLFRWFVGLGIDDRVWVPTTFSKNRDRLLEGQVAKAFLAAVVAEAKRRDVVSDDHFTVDGTLMEAWASQKSFRPKDEEPGDGPQGRNPEADFRKEKRSNETHESKTDPDARLARKANGQEARLSYQGNVLMENRHGLVVDAEVAIVTGTSEVDTALAMLDRLPRRERRRTVGADKIYDQERFVKEARARRFTPHVAQNTTNRRSRIDGRTTMHTGYAESQRRRKLVEQGFGWEKTVGLLRKVRHRGRDKVDWVFVFAVGVYDMIRIRTVERERVRVCA
jgi:transposase